MTKMRKSHILLLVLTVVLALTSAYSLAAINQVYKINFEWYSQYYNKFVNEPRETSMDSWQLHDYPAGMRFNLIVNEAGLSDENYKNNPYFLLFKRNDFSKNIILECSLGKVYSPDYRLKVMDIAQRGSVVEVKVSMNSPQKTAETIMEPRRSYTVVDIIRISRSSFPIKGRLHFIFKNQDGIKLAEDYYDIL